MECKFKFGESVPTRSQKFIEKYRRVLDAGPEFYNPDTEMMSTEDYNNSDLKVLIVFPSPVEVKDVSSTKPALNDIVKSICNQPRSAEQNAIPWKNGFPKSPNEDRARGPLNVFIDFAFMPGQADIKLYDKHQIPYAIGQITHLDASHFDVVGFSISVLSDNLGAPQIITTFKNCDTPIYPTWSERRDLSLSQTPLIFAGGITCAVGDIMFGDLQDGTNRQSFIDVLYLGAGEKLDLIFERLIKSKDMKVQEFIDTLFDLYFIYQPQAYRVTFNDKNQIVENVKINPKAQDFVSPYYPLELDPAPGIARTIINGRGGNTGTAQSAVSEGCSAAGACSFKVAKGTRIWTNKGIVRIEELPSGRIVALGDERFLRVDKQSSDKVVVVRTKDGHELRCDANHKWLIVDGDWFKEVKTSELHKGDVILRRINNEFDHCNDITPEFAEFLGFMHGDGCFGKSYNGGTPRWKIYMSEEELSHYEPLFRKFVPTSAKTRVHYKSNKKTIYVIEGNRVDFGFDIAEVSSGELYVPDCIFESSEESIGAYLRGVFQADGWFTGSLSLTSISKRFIKDVSILLASLGIDCTIRKNGYFDRHALEGHKASYYLSIPKIYQNGFIVKVGFVTKNKVVTPKGNRTKSYLKNTVEIQNNIKQKLDRESARKCGIGSLWESPRNRVSDAMWQNAKGFIPEGRSVRYLVSTGKFVTDSIDEVIFTEEVEEMYDVVGTDSSYCVYDTILTHNCSEGNYTGGFVEKTKEQILLDCKDAKKFGFCYKYKPYSFNMLLADTFIPTPIGFRRVSDLKTNDQVQTPRGVGVVGRTLHTIKDKYLEFELTRGVPARMSVEHKQMILTEEGLVWKKANEIKVGDWIPQSVGYLPTDNYKFSVEGYVLGLWFGDGNRRGGEEWTGNMLNFNLAEVELIDFCKKLGIIRTVTPRTDGNVGVATIVSHGDLIKRTFPNYKYGEHNLDKLSLNEILSFIRGWFDSDGCTSYNQSQSDPTRSCRIHVAFSTKSMKVARFVGMVLQSVGINFHMTKPVKVVLNGKECFRRDLVITGRRSRELFVNLIGFTEPSKLSKISTEKTKWSDKDKTLPGIFGVWVKRSLGDKCHGFNVSKFFNGLKGITEDRFQSLFESVDVEPVRLFKNGMRFSQVTAIKLHDEKVDCVDIEETTVHQYLTEFGYTHNCNYLTDYKGMLGEFMKIFPKVTFINMRMEELGRDVDAMRIMKLIGSNRISFPLEGLSPRIQNNLLNKCLSEDALNNALGWCVPKTSKVLTPNGYREVGALHEGDYVTVHGRDYRVESFIDSGMKEAFKVELGDGSYITTSAEHRVPTQRGLLKVSELSVGDFLQKDSSKVFGDREVPYAYYLGYYLGDGCLSPTDNTVSFYVPEHEDYEWFSKKFEELYGTALHKQLHSDSGVKIYKYHICDKNVRSKFTEHGLLHETASTKRLPSDVWEFNRESARLLLQGLFDADGSVTCYNTYTHVELGSSSKDLLFEVQLLLQSFGVYSRVRRHSKEKIHTINGRTVLTKESYCLDIRAYDVFLFRNSVGFANEEKAAKLNNAKIKNDNSYVPGVKEILRPWFRLNQHMFRNKHTNLRKKLGRGKESNYEYTVKEIEEWKSLGILPENVVEVLDNSMKGRWEKVVSLSQLGMEEMCDINVEGVHIFNLEGVVVHNCVHGGMADLKVGGIFTGYEEQEDIDWICNLVEKFKTQAKREDGTFNFRLKCTPLVHYPLTPLEFLERKSTRKSYEGEHWLTDEWYEQFKAHDVFFKVNGFRFSTFMEQTIVDLGRSATGWLWNILQSDSKIYSLRSVASEENINALKALVNPDYFFNDRDPEHYISICHRIHIDLMGSYIPRARRLLRCKKEGDVFKNTPDIRCLKTFEGAKTKCYKMCVAKDPLKIYNDVTMDEEGNLHGEFRDLKGCERCPDNAHRMARLNREYKASLNSDGIMAIPRIKKAQKIRFTLVRNPEYDVLNPNNTAHTFGSRILQADESLVDSFRELTRHSMFWQADPDMPYMCSGYQIVDTVWSSKVFDKVKLAVAQANQTLKSLQIVKVTEEFIDEDIRVDDINIFRFESDLPFELFESSALSYKGEVKVKKDVNSEIIQDTTLVPPVFRTKGKTIGYFACPTRYNPYYYLQGFFNAKKITTNTLVESTKLHCSMVVRESMSICKCGKEKSVTSLITGKSLPFGKQCLLKALLLKEFK